MAKALKVRLEWPIAGATCGVCGSTEAEIYPKPGEHGTCWCPTCSPGWLREFARWATAQAGLVLV